VATRRTPISALIAVAIVPLSIALVAPSNGQAAPPTGFTDSFVTSVSGPTDVDWTPDGRMLIINKAGQVRV